MGDLRSLRITEDGSTLILTAEDGRAFRLERAELSRKILPEVWRFAEVEPGITIHGQSRDAEHVQFGHDGLVPAEILYTDRGESAPKSLQFSRIEWRGGLYSFVDCQSIEVEPTA